MKSILLVKKFLGLVEMTSGLVNASFSLPEWQAVKMIFFASCSAPRSNPLPFNLPFLTEKETPFVHLPLTNGAPFMYLDMFRALHTFQPL